MVKNSFSKQALVLSTVVILLCGCSLRYANYRRDYKKQLVGELSQEEFDRKYYTLYDESTQVNPAEKSVNLKFKGCYVTQIMTGKYIVFKFLPNGKVIDTHQVDHYPTNSDLIKVGSTYHYYVIMNDTVKIEYLQERDRQLYNIIMIGRIEGDSLTFFERTNIQLPHLNNRKYRQIYIYDPELTVSPM
ncbi:hypothetical protein [Halocola ammonii]